MKVRYMYHAIKLLFALFLFLLSSQRGASKNKINVERIRDQVQFDKFVDEVNAGKEKYIELSKGSYMLKKAMFIKAPLIIKGKKAIITIANDTYTRNVAEKFTDTHYVCKLNNPLGTYSLFLDEYDNNLPVTESVNSHSLVNNTTLVEAKGGLKKNGQIKILLNSDTKNLANKKFEMAYGYFDCGWEIVHFNAIWSDDRYLYCKILNTCQNQNPNYDQQVYHKPIRYVLYNTEINKGKIYYDKEYVYIPHNVSSVTCVNNSTFGDNPFSIVVKGSKFILTGVTFKNFDGIVIDVTNGSHILIDDCLFKNTLGYTLKIVDSKSNKPKILQVRNCSFYSCSLTTGSIIEYIGNGGLGKLVLSDCKISRYPESRVKYKNCSPAIRIKGNADLVGNLVYNTCRTHFSFTEGLIKAINNICFNDDSFNSYELRSLSSDFGLMYCNHLFDNTWDALDNSSNKISLINNLLYGASAYGGDARGIFIDDGRGDVECINNIVINSQYYSIDSRNVKLTEASSIRNRFEGNIVTSQYRLYAGSAVKGMDMPTTSKNVLLNVQKGIESNAIVVQDDVRQEIDTKCCCVNKKIYVSKKLYNLIRQTNDWNFFKSYIKRI